MMIIIFLGEDLPKKPPASREDRKLNCLCSKSRQQIDLNENKTNNNTATGSAVQVQDSIGQSSAVIAATGLHPPSGQLVC